LEQRELYCASLSLDPASPGIERAYASVFILVGQARLMGVAVSVTTAMMWALRDMGLEGIWSSLIVFQLVKLGGFAIRYHRDAGTTLFRPLSTGPVTDAQKGARRQALWKWMSSWQGGKGVRMRTTREIEDVIDLN
jgi:hypothetical protein